MKKMVRWVGIRPQGTILTLYGDYIRYRGGTIWVGSLVHLLESFGLSEQAIRSALSRMCRKGLLQIERKDKRSYYSLTKDGAALLAKGASRIFERRNGRWDGTWNIVTYSIPERRREVRARLRQELSWMGYGPLGNATWVSPYDLTEQVEELARTLRIRGYLEVFQARHLGFSHPSELVARCWDIKKIHQDYEAFIGKYNSRLGEHLRRLEEGVNIDPGQCFAERFMLIHEYRRFPYVDPDLPAELLPWDWPRPRAAALFQSYHDLLAERANEYFDLVFERRPGRKWQAPRHSRLSGNQKRRREWEQTKY